MDSPQEITQLLLAWEQGDESALERLMPLVMKELRLIAKNYMRKEKRGHLLQTTALVNEAYLKLVNQKQTHWRNRAQFFGVAAMCMRRILVDYAKARKREKRGGGADHIELSDAPSITVEKSDEVLAIDEALEKLARQDERKCRIVQLLYFGGCSVKEVAELLRISESTISREWRLARAWLKRELDDNSDRLLTQ